LVWIVLVEGCSVCCRTFVHIPGPTRCQEQHSSPNRDNQKYLDVANAQEPIRVLRLYRQTDRHTHIHWLWGQNHPR
jgi:hypothetical protein